MQSLITYSVEEIDLMEERYCFSTGDLIELDQTFGLVNEAMSCLANMGDRLSDFGVMVFEEIGTIYIVRSHYTLPIVGA